MTCPRCGVALPAGQSACAACGLLSQGRYWEEQLDLAVAAAYQGHTFTAAYQKLRAHLREEPTR